MAGFAAMRCWAVCCGVKAKVESSGRNNTFSVAQGGFALTVESILLRQNRRKPSALTSGPTSSGSFAPVPWCGYAPTRHPWRNGARPASMPVAPPHDTYAQPPDARLAVSAKLRHKKRKAKSEKRKSKAEATLQRAFNVSATRGPFPRAWSKHPWPAVSSVYRTSLLPGRGRCRCP